MQPTKCPKCQSAIIAVEYPYGSPHRYDGVSEYACVYYLTDGTCDFRCGRWCGRILKKGEVEPKFCRDVTKPHPTV